MGSAGSPAPQTLTRCTRCILPENHPGLTFDAEGVCSQCHAHDRQRPKPRGEEALARDVEPYRNSGRKYDCAFGLSGGRDSTYSLYHAVKVLKLKPLAFTVDQGFIPDETWANIENATRILGVDHFRVKHDLTERSIKPMIKAWLRRPSPGMVTFMCLGCRLGLYQTVQKISRQYSELPICLTGNGEPQEEEFARSFYTTSSSRMRAVAELACGIGMDLLRNPRYFLPPSLPWRMFIEGMYVFPPPIEFIRKKVRMRWKNIDVMRYLPYDEEKIERVLQGELGWKRYHHAAAGWRSDCKIPLLKNVMYKKLLGFTRHDGLISGVIRRGLLTREEGLARVAHDNDIPEEFLREFLAEIDLPYEETWGRARWDRARI